MIRTLTPDLVVTDIRMPGQDGISMLKNAPVPAALILTGHSDFAYAREAIRLGVKDYIVKPVDDEEFFKALKSVSDSLLKEEETHNLPSSPFREYMKPPKMDKQDYYVNSAIEYINENYSRDISLRDASESIGITESYLSRLFRTRTTYSFLEYLRNQRLKKALEMMNNQGVSINEVARMTGFRDMSYFSGVFKKHIGVSPSRYLNGITNKETIQNGEN
jgi:two-component system response regulator YesN